MRPPYKVKVYVEDADGKMTKYQLTAQAVQYMQDRNYSPYYIDAPTRLIGTPTLEGVTFHFVCSEVRSEHER